MTGTLSDPLIFRRVLAAADVKAGQMRAVELDGRSIVVCHTKDGWSALDNLCTHAYARMSEGRLRGHRLVCPLHGASFDCRSGAVLSAPAIEPLKTYPVRCMGEDVEVAI
jgi:nitrite reductase/ring-hydroxylating ferredoxin subunit